MVVGRCHPMRGLSRFVAPTLAHHIDKYKVLGNGHLKFIGRTPDMAVPGASGLAGL